VNCAFFQLVKRKTFLDLLYQNISTHLHKQSISYPFSGYAHMKYDSGKIAVAVYAGVLIEDQPV
jgi:hypothetical protein